MPASAFFDGTVPDRWGILPFLNAYRRQSCQKKTRFDFSAAINCYLNSLRTIIASNPGSIKAHSAQALFNSYYEKGRSSDKARAQKWKRRNTDSRDGMSKVAPPTKQSYQKRRTGPQTIIYNNHGTMVNGSVSRSSFGVKTQLDGSSSQPRIGRKHQNPDQSGDEDEDEDKDEDEDEDEDVDDDDEDKDKDKDDEDEEGEKEDEWEKVDQGTTISDGSDECTREDPREELTLVEFLTNLDRTSQELQNKLELPNGKYLEDVLIEYAKTLENLGVAHWLIVDPADTRLMALLFSHGWKDEVECQSFGLPQLPKALGEHMSKYAKVINRAECKAIAYSTDQEWNTLGCDPDQLFLKRWIDDASDHAISLITESDGLLKQPLNEGAWEGLYYPILDKCFTNLGELMLQRDTMLLAHEHNTNPVLNYSVRHDGVLHTRNTFPQRGRRLEFAVIEVSRQFGGYDSIKWNGDCTKLYAGCLAILRDLKEAVNHHPPTVAKLAAAAVLQAGRMTVVLIVSCLGPNLYYLRRGEPREFPCETHGFDKFGDLLTAIWKARETVRRSYQVVKEYFNDIKNSRRAVSRTDAGFL